MTPQQKISSQLSRRSSDNDQFNKFGKMFSKLCAVFICLLFGAMFPYAAVAQQSDSKFPLFDNAAAAQHRCPFDVVVWLDTKTDTYVIGAPPAGSSKDSGAYMCQRDADQMDYMPMQNQH